MSEKKIRVWLSVSVSIVTVILFAFIWLVNMNQTAEIRSALRMYILVLGFFVIASLVIFFLFTEIFDGNGNLEKSKALTMIILMLLIAQVAFSFASYTSQQTNMTFRTMDSAKLYYDQLDKAENLAECNYDGDIPTVMHVMLLRYPEFEYAAIVDQENRVLCSDGTRFEVGEVLERDAVADCILPIGRNGSVLLLRTSEAYAKKQLSKAFSELLTIMAASIFLTIELMLFAMRLLDKRIAIGKLKEENNEGKTLPSDALYYVRQIAFLFYFASRLPSSFISVMAKQYGGSFLGIQGDVLTGIPQSAETLFTCAAIFVTAKIIEDKGWKPSFTVGLVLVVIGNALTAFSPNIVIFILARAVTGLGYGFCWMTLRNFALFGRNEEEKSEGFTLLNAGLYAGINCGSVLGSILADKLGFQVVLLISAVLTILCVASILKLENEVYVNTRKATKMATDYKKNELGINPKVGFSPYLKAVAFVILMITPTCIAGAYISYYLPLYFTNTGGSIADAGRANLLYGLLIIYAGPYFGKLLGKHPGYVKWNVFYNVIMGAGFILFGLFDSYALAFVCVLMLGLADSFGFAAQNNYFLKLKSIEKMGDSVAMSVLSFIKKMAEMLGPIVFSLVLAVGSPFAFFTVGIVFVAAVLFYLLFEIKGDKTA